MMGKSIRILIITLSVVAILAVLVAGVVWALRSRPQLPIAQGPA